MHDWKPKMQKVARHFAEQVRGIRSGTVSIGLIQTIRVDCQGHSVPINRLGAVKSQGDRILITPFDRANVPSIVRSLIDSRLRHTPSIRPRYASAYHPSASNSAKRRPVTSRSWARKPRSPSGRSANRHANKSNPRAVDRNAPSRKQPTPRSKRSNNW